MYFLIRSYCSRRRVERLLLNVTVLQVPVKGLSISAARMKKPKFDIDPITGMIRIVDPETGKVTLMDNYSFE